MACGFHTVSLNKEVVGSVDLWVYAASFGFGKESSNKAACRLHAASSTPREGEARK